MRQIKEIIVHCSATPEGKNFTIEDIDRWHKQRGFDRIGYHYVIYLDGSIVIGRKEEEVGAHCAGNNSFTIGVCYIGGMDKKNLSSKDTRTLAQKESLLKLLKELKSRYPNASIHSHRDYAKKDCPSFDATTEYKDL